jgi:hypothetical protein
VSGNLAKYRSYGDTRENMPRLDNKDLKEHRLALEAWQRPEELLARADAIMDQMGKADFFNQSGLAFVREAWAAGKFGIERGVDAARLAPDAFPDFELRVGSAVEGWEFTEADDERRRRGEEMSAGKGRDGDYLNVVERAPEELERVCQTKARKRYGEKVRLLVLLNIPSYGARQQETIESFRPSTAPAKDVFSEVWVLWNSRAYPVWRNGRAV